MKFAKTISYVGGFCMVMLLVFGADTKDKLSGQDRKFMMDAAKGGMMEVHMGREGLNKGSSAALKTLSQHLVDDHTKGGQELKALAAEKGVKLPADDPMMPSKLGSKSGADFDREFAKMAVEDHQKDIAEFEKEATSGSDPDVKAWAAKTLPVLRSHLELAKAAQNAAQ